MMENAYYNVNQCHKLAMILTGLCYVSKQHIVQNEPISEATYIASCVASYITYFVQNSMIIC